MGASVVSVVGDALSAWRLMADAEEAIESGADVGHMDPDTVARARRNVAWRKRQDAAVELVKSTWDSRTDAVRPRIVEAWSHFDRSDPCQGPIRLGHVDACDSVKAVRKFLADDTLRFLVLLGGVGCGKTFAAMVGAWDAQARVSEQEADHEMMRPMSDFEFDGVGSKGVDAWFEERVAYVTKTRRPSRQWSLWHARELAVLWEPWKAETDAGRTAGKRDRPYIVLDDLGTERESDRLFGSFGAFVDHRMVGRAKTVITTNLAKGDIRARYGDRIADRINHVGKSFVVGGDTRRKNGAGL